MINLPNEILLSIFKHLPFWDLKFALPLVCKHWKFLIDIRTESGELDKVLFRDKPAELETVFSNKRMAFGDIDSLEGLLRATDANNLYFRGPQERSPLNLHPALDMLTYKFEGGMDAVTFERAGQRTKLISTPCASENAVSPAYSKLKLKIGCEPSFVVGPGSGVGGAVTVFDVVQAFIEYYDQDFDADMPYRVSDSQWPEVKPSRRDLYETAGLKLEWGGIYMIMIRTSDGMPCLCIKSAFDSDDSSP